MAYTTIDDPSAYFQTKLYSGNGGTQSITLDGNSDLQPDWVWIKQRNNAEDHFLFDSVRGVKKRIISNTNDVEDTHESLTSFNSDGFSLGNARNEVNQSGASIVAWNWKAGTAISSASTGGSGTNKTYSGSVSTTAGFSIIAYVGNGTDNHQVPHHLGAIPKMFIMKNRSTAGGWNVYHHTQTASNGALFNSTDAYGGDGSMLNNVEPTSVYVNLGDSSETNKNDDNHIMYAFAEKQGYSKFGSYKGNNNADGPFIYLGFKPEFLIMKETSGTGNWAIIDSTRSFHNVGNHTLASNLDDREDQFGGGESVNGGSNKIDLVSNGFKIREASAYNNGSGDDYIYMAFAENPFVTSTGIPTTAR